jgi:hypothetical protein
MKHHRKRNLKSAAKWAHTNAQGTLYSQSIQSLFGLLIVWYFSGTLTRICIKVLVERLLAKFSNLFSPWRGHRYRKFSYLLAP